MSVVTMPPYETAVTTWVYELATAPYGWDTPAARYRSGETGRFVSDSVIRGDLERFNNVVRDELTDLTQRWADGNITLEQWQNRITNQLRDSWRWNAMAGRGGKSQMTQEDWGRMGGRMRFEYDRLNRLAIEMKAEMLTPAQVQARMGLFAQAARVGYYDGVTAAKEATGFTEMRRVLNPAEHCEDCEGYEAQGWVPIGALPMPGEASACMRNCKCTVEYR